VDARAERRVAGVRDHQIERQGERHRTHNDEVQAPPRRVSQFIIHREDVLVARKAEDEDRQILERAEVGHDVPRLRVSVRREHLAHHEERDAAAANERRRAHEAQVV
jgi:hypothetical protein